jgi:hypothetical protein
MKDHVLDTYLLEAETQAEFALNAIRAVNNVLPRLLGDDGASLDFERRMTLHREVFRTIHSFLTHASNLSRLFWPPQPAMRQRESVEQFETRVPRVRRGRNLRAALGLPDEGHILKDRRLRDHLEHFDERLDAWQAESERHNFVQDFIGPKNGGIVGIEDTDMMRWFDPTTNNFRFRGEEYDLQALADAVAEMQQQVRILAGQRRANRR